jgi:mRNA interferase HigB
MRIHLIKKQSIEAYILNHPESKRVFFSWLSTIKYSNWNKPEEIKHTFASADLLCNGSNRVIFNIGGNNHRMICKYFFGGKKNHLFVCWIGSHSEYIEICDQRKQFTINQFYSSGHLKPTDF